VRRRRGIWSEAGPLRRRRHSASRWPRTTIVTKAENHSLPGNYVTVTFLEGSPVPPGGFNPGRRRENSCGRGGSTCARAITSSGRSTARLSGRNHTPSRSSANRFSCRSLCSAARVRASVPTRMDQIELVSNRSIAQPISSYEHDPRPHRQRISTLRPARPRQQLSTLVIGQVHSGSNRNRHPPSLPCGSRSILEYSVQNRGWVARADNSDHFGRSRWRHGHRHDRSVASRCSQWSVRCRGDRTRSAHVLACHMRRRPKGSAAAY